MNLETLNKNQRTAVMHNDGPCLVIAGAGSGKTKVLTTRIARLIEEGVYSSNILAITFTNKAASEMKERLYNIAGENYSFVGTFHSFGVRIVKDNAQKCGLAKNFTILDGDDSKSIIKKIMKDMNIDTKDINPNYIKNKISFIKNQMLTQAGIDLHFNSYIDKKVLEVYNEYDLILSKNNTIDFDDLLKKPVELFVNNPDILEQYQDKYKYILVDEYQDTNEVQYKLIKLLSKKHGNIFVVGDVNQSIYAFRWSNYKNILNFEKDFKNSTVVTLNQNYRSTTTILNAANSIIKNNKERKDVDLFSDLGDGNKINYIRTDIDINENKYVTDQIKSLLSKGYDKKDIAIFYRTNGQSRAIEESLLKASIPYKVVGSFTFYKRKEIKDLISYLKVICNPLDDISLERIINVPKRGIGATSVNKLINKAYDMNASIFDAIEISTGLIVNTETKEEKFKKLIIKMQEAKEDLSLTEFIDYVLEHSGMLKELKEEKTLEADLRIENLMEFKSITENYQKETGSVNLEDFLEEVSLVADTVEDKEDNDLVTLMTIHASKGLEFKIVFIIGMEEGILPHINSLDTESQLEEERRLCYVALTRAKEKLYISNSERRMLYGKTEYHKPSRFIDEIDSIYLEKVENKSKVIINDRKISRPLNGDTSINTGDVIMHSMFGKGSVVSKDDRFYTIAFNKRFGVKKVIVGYAGMKKI